MPLISSASRGWQLTAAQLTCEPGSCQPPVAHHCLRRYVKNFGSFVHAQSAKEPQLDDLRTPRIDLRQRFERLVQGADGGGRIRVIRRDAVQIDCR